MPYQGTALQLTTTDARPGGKAPARTDSGWKYSPEHFPAGCHTPGSYPGQLADVYARHAQAFALDLDLHKPGMAGAWEASATRRAIGDRPPYIRRGTAGSRRYLVAVTPEQAAQWWPAASGMPWGDIRSRGIAPSPGSAHPSGDAYEAVPGPDAVRYPDGRVIMTNVIQFDDALRTALEADGAHDRDSREMTTGDAGLPTDDGRCPKVLAWLENHGGPGYFDGATPRGSRANGAVNFLKLCDAEGHHIGGWVDEVTAMLPDTGDADFAGMWASAPVPPGMIRLPRDCCTPAPFGALNGQVPAPRTAPDSADSDLAAVASRYAAVNWHEAWDGQPEDVDWQREPVLERGTVNVLFSRPGTGKSLLAEEIALELVRAGETVVYVDDENRITDLVERFRDMGATPAELARLKLYSFAALPSLDTPEGGYHLLALAVTNGAGLVVIDTTSRFVAGAENDSDTYLRLYRCALVPLKQRGITVLRLDHPGKDEDRGQRGSSAKDGDADTIWHLTETMPGALYQLRRKKSRNGHGAGLVVLRRLRDPLRHEWELSALSGQSRLAQTMAELNIPPDAGRPAVREALKAAGVKAPNDLLSAAIRERRELSGQPTDSADSSSLSASAANCPAVPPYTGDSGQLSGHRSGLDDLGQPLDWSAHRATLDRLARESRP